MAIDGDAFVCREIEFVALEQFIRIGHALLQSFDESIEYLASRGGIRHTAPSHGHITEGGPIMLELGEVRFQEVQMLRVERFKVAIEESAGKSVIKWQMQIMICLQEAGGDPGDAAIGQARGDMDGAGGFFGTLH